MQDQATAPTEVTADDVIPVGRRRKESMILPWPTSSGAGLLLAMVGAWAMATNQVVAVGFLILFGCLMALDFVLSAMFVAQRPVSITPVRATVAVPRESLRFVGSTTSVDGHLRVLLRRLGWKHEDFDFVHVHANQTAFELTSEPTAFARGTKHIRHRSEHSYFGLVWARRHVTEEIPFVSIGLSPDETVDAVPTLGTDLAKLREYIPGDRMSRISWPTTARTGRLHVRAEEIVSDDVTVVVDLGGTGMLETDAQGRPRGERAVRLAAAVVEDLLAEGRAVELVSMQLREKFFDQERDAALQRPEVRSRPDLRIDFETGHSSLDDEPVMELVRGAVPDTTELMRRLARVDHSAEMEYPSRPFVLVTPTGVVAYD